MVDTTTAPIFQGTVRYLKELGKWTAEYEQTNNKATELLEKHYEAYKAAMAEAKNRGITPSHDNETYLEILAKHKAGLPDFSVRQ